MTTLIIVHEVSNADVWAKAWKKGPGSRQELFASVGATARTFRDPKNLSSVGLIVDVSDMARFEAMLASPEGKQAMKEDGLKVETIRILAEFTP
jgi:hypothetical protein